MATGVPRCILYLSTHKSPKQAMRRGESKRKREEGASKGKNPNPTPYPNPKEQKKTSGKKRAHMSPRELKGYLRILLAKLLWLFSGGGSSSFRASKQKQTLFGNDSSSSFSSASRCGKSCHFHLPHEEFSKIFGGGGGGKLANTNKGFIPQTGSSLQNSL